MIDILMKAAYKAGKIQLYYFKKGIDISYKLSHQNLVTKADLESQSIIQKTITDEMLKKGFKKNEIGFIGEEQLHIKGTHQFIIDPVDGTTNFACGLDQFGISIAHYINQQPAEGLIYLPSNNKLYFAVKEKGSYIGKRKLSIEYKNLHECLLSTYLSSNEKLRQGVITFITKLFPHIRGVRLLGSIVVQSALLAENIIQIDCDAHAGLWDIAAAKIILEEAGTSVVNFDGRPLEFDFNIHDKYYQVLSCHPKLLNEILKYFD